MNKELKEITELLDNLLGDTEPFIDPDWDDETIQDEEPLFWAVRELYKYTAIIDKVKQISMNCIEINIDNYDEAQVEEINNKMIAICSIFY